MLNKIDLENFSDRDMLEKIVEEFYDSSIKLEDLPPCISIFGSAKTPEDSKHYKLAEDISTELSNNGFGIITGGGPGIMEAGNKGVKDKNIPSVGLSIKLPFEKSSNQHVDEKYDVVFDYFFIRKVMFTKYSKAFVVMPGGMGTLDELFEVITLIQTSKMQQKPIVLVGKEYWEGLIKWLNETMLEQEYISSKDLDLFKIIDTPQEISAFMRNHI